MVGFNQFYLLTHALNAESLIGPDNPDENRFYVWGAQKLADYAVRNGLVGWLLDKGY